MARTRRTLLVSLAAGLVAVGVGCGDGGQADEVSVEAPLDLLSAVEDAGSARASFRWANEASLAGDDDDTLGRWEVDVELEGVVAFGDEPRSTFAGRFAMGMVLPEGAVDEAPPPRVTTMEMRFVGAESWSREGRDDGALGPWTVQQSSEPDEDDAEQEGGDDPFALLGPESFDPTGFVEGLRDAAEGFTELGEEDVRGDRATRYEVLVDRSIGEEGDWYGLDGKVEVWIDGDERLRRVRGGGLEMELWDFGVPVAVEPPDDVADVEEDSYLDDLSFLPEIVGDWELQAEGSAGGAPWQIFVAPGRAGDVDVACRTFEPAGVDRSEGEWLEDELGSFPNHDGVDAECGAGSYSLQEAVADPALQVLVGDGLDPDGLDLVAFVVSERFRDGPVRIVLDGSDPVELSLDGTGVAVWDASALGEGIAAVELDGGAVRCPMARVEGSGEDEGEYEYSPSATEQLYGGTAPCVRA